MGIPVQWIVLEVGIIPPGFHSRLGLKVTGLFLAGTHAIGGKNDKHRIPILILRDTFPLWLKGIDRVLLGLHEMKDPGKLQKFENFINVRDHVGDFNVPAVFPHFLDDAHENPDTGA